MTDREILELAAKAAGFADISISPMLKKHASDPEKLVVFAVDTDFSRVFWNPLDDDGAALRLACTLNLSVCFTLGTINPPWGTAMAGFSPWDQGSPLAAERYRDQAEKHVATRRAITRAAAEIGKAMQETTS